MKRKHIIFKDMGKVTLILQPFQVHKVLQNTSMQQKGTLGEIRPFITRHESRQKSNLKRKFPFLRSLEHKRGTVEKTRSPRKMFSKNIFQEESRSDRSYHISANPRHPTRHWLPKHECSYPRKYQECWARAPTVATSAATSASPVPAHSSLPWLVLQPLELQAGEKLGQGYVRGCAIREYVNSGHPSLCQSGETGETAPEGSRSSIISN